MAPNTSRLDGIQSRAVNVAARTTYRIRRNATRSIERNAVFTFGAEAQSITNRLNSDIVDAYIAGFETTVPERGLRTVQRKYGINPEDILRRFGTTEINEYLINVSSRLEETIITLQQSNQSKTGKQRVLRKEFEDLGLTGNPYRIEAIINTATNAAFNAGRLAGFNLPQNEQRIWGYRYQTQKDDRVRDNHQAMQGFTRDKNDPSWAVYSPPNGYNCRCYLEALTSPTSQTQKLPALPDEGFRGPLNAS